MNAEKFTQKTIEIINDAQNLARERQNQTLAAEHLLYALLAMDGGLVRTLVMRIGQKNGRGDIITPCSAIPTRLSKSSRR